MYGAVTLSGQPDRSGDMKLPNDDDSIPCNVHCEVLNVICMLVYAVYVLTDEMKSLS